MTPGKPTFPGVSPSLMCFALARMKKPIIRYIRNRRGGGLVLPLLLEALRWDCSVNCSAARPRGRPTTLGVTRKWPYIRTSSACGLMPRIRPGSRAINRGEAVRIANGVFRKHLSKEITRDPSVVRKYKRTSGYPNGRAGYEVDHRIPIGLGGKDDPGNLQWLTVERHKEKTASESTLIRYVRTRCRQ
jgi:hypothetical protein